MNRSIKVIDDVVSDIYQHYIEESVSGLPWEFKDGVSFGEYSHREYDNPTPDVDPHTGFANVVYDALYKIRKPESDFLIPLLFYTNIVSLFANKLKSFLEKRKVNVSLRESVLLPPFLNEILNFCRHHNFIRPFSSETFLRSLFRCIHTNM